MDYPNNLYDPYQGYYPSRCPQQRRCPPPPPFNPCCCPPIRSPTGFFIFEAATSEFGPVDEGGPFIGPLGTRIRLWNEDGNVTLTQGSILYHIKDAHWVWRHWYTRTNGAPGSDRPRSRGNRGQGCDRKSRKYRLQGVNWVSRRHWSKHNRSTRWDRSQRERLEQA